MWFTSRKSSSCSPTLTGEKSPEVEAKNGRVLGILKAILEAPQIVVKGWSQPTGYRWLTRAESRSMVQALLPALHYREPPTVDRGFHPQDDGPVVVAYGPALELASFTWRQSTFSHLMTVLTEAWNEQ